MASRKLSDLQARIAAQIVDYAARERLEEGAHLTELHLAALFGVSRSPVAAALRYLADQGLLRAVRNHGFFLRVPGVKLNPQRVELPEPEEQQLYDTLLTDRLERKLPDEVTEAELMRRYEAPRGLLRKVLQQLAQESLIVRSQGYGWTFVPALDSEAAHDESYRFRLLLEPAGLLEPTFRLDPKVARGIHQSHERVLGGHVKRLPRLEWFEMNAAFHEGLAACSGNRFVLQAIQQQNRLRRLLEYKGMVDARRVAQSCREHLEVIEALEKGETEWASTLLRRHLEVASRLKLAFQRQAPARRATAD